jgi:hypothetical protein
MRQQLDTLVKLPHSLGNLLGHFGVAKVRWSQGDGIEELLESTILECTEQSWSDSLACQPLQHLELVVSVDEVLNLWTIDTKQKLGRHTLALDLVKVTRRVDNVDGVGESTAETLHGDLISASKRDASPPLEPEGVCDTNDFVLEVEPVLTLLFDLIVGAVGGRQVLSATTACVAHGLGIVQPSIAAGNDGVSIDIVGIGGGTTQRGPRGNLSVLWTCQLGRKVRNRREAHVSHRVLQNALKPVEGNIA